MRGCMHMACPCVRLAETGPWRVERRRNGERRESRARTAERTGERRRPDRGALVPLLEQRTSASKVISRKYESCLATGSDLCSRIVSFGTKYSGRACSLLVSSSFSGGACEKSRRGFWVDKGHVTDASSVSAMRKALETRFRNGVDRMSKACFLNSLRDHHTRCLWRNVDDIQPTFNHAFRHVRSSSTDATFLKTFASDQIKDRSPVTLRRYLRACYADIGFQRNHPCGKSAHWAGHVVASGIEPSKARGSGRPERSKI